MTEDISLSNLNIDALIKLAQDNPEEFENTRQTLIDTYINESRPCQQQRLRGLQFTLDATRQMSKTPLQSCLTIYNRMWQNVGDLIRAFEGERPVLPKSTGQKVLAFQKEPESEI